MAEWDNDQDFAKVQWAAGYHDHHVQKVMCIFRSRRILWPPFFCCDTGNPLQVCFFWWGILFKVMFDPFYHGKKHLLIAFVGNICSIPSWSLTARPQKVRKANVFQPPFFRGELLNFGGVYLTFGHLKQGDLRKWPNINLMNPAACTDRHEKMLRVRLYLQNLLFFWHYCSPEKQIIRLFFRFFSPSPSVVITTAHPSTAYLSFFPWNERFKAFEESQIGRCFISNVSIQRPFICFIIGKIVRFFGVFWALTDAKRTNQTSDLSKRKDSSKREHRQSTNKVDPPRVVTRVNFTLVTHWFEAISKGYPPGN